MSEQNLTKEEEVQITAIMDKWYKGKFLCTDPVDREEANKWLTKLHHQLSPTTELKEIIWASGPREALRLREEKARELGVPAPPKNQGFIFFQNLTPAMGFFEMMETVFGYKKEVEDKKILSECCKNIGWGWFHENYIFATERMDTVKVDKEMEAHCEDGPAISWPDGTKFFFFHGIAVPEQVIMAPETLTVKQINEESNAEVRRIMVTRKGIHNYLDEANAKEVATDDRGTLYKVEQSNDDPIMFVRVLNSTAEPDGSFKEYNLLVDPNAYGRCDTVQKALASLIRYPDGSLVFEDAADYEPLVET